MKYLSILRYVLLIVSALSVALYFVGGVPDVDMMLWCAYILFGVTIVITILMPLFAIAQNPKSAVRSLLGLAIVAVVVLVAYSLSSDMPIPNSAGGEFVDSAVLKISDTGLFAAYAAFTATIVSIIGGEIIRLFK